MTETTFRSASVTPISSAPAAPPPDPSNVAPDLAPDTIEDIEPIDNRESRSGDVLLEVLGIDEPLSSLPSEDVDNLQETKSYIKSIIKSRGIEPTMGNFKRVLDDLKGEMGLDEAAEPGMLLDRIGGVVKAWRELGFLKDADKKRVFSRLLRSKDSNDANRIVFEEMENHKIWL